MKQLTRLRSICEYTRMLLWFSSQLISDLILVAIQARLSSTNQRYHQSSDQWQKWWIL